MTKIKSKPSSRWHYIFISVFMVFSSTLFAASNIVLAGLAGDTKLLSPDQKKSLYVFLRYYLERYDGKEFWDFDSYGGPFPILNLFCSLDEKYAKHLPRSPENFN